MTDEFVVVPSTGPCSESYLRALKLIWTESEVERKYQRWVGRYVIQEATVWGQMTKEEKSNKFTTDECQLIVIEGLEEETEYAVPLNLSGYSLNRRVWTIRPDSQYGTFKDWHVKRSEVDANSILIQTDGKTYNICFDKPNQLLLDKFIEPLQRPAMTFVQYRYTYPTATMVETELTRIVTDTSKNDLTQDQPGIRSTTSDTNSEIHAEQEQLDENEPVGQEIYVVTVFSCEGDDMRIPETYVFTDKEKAFIHYRRSVPPLGDECNRAELHPCYDTEWNHYLEAIVQCGGYAGGNGGAKRPYGAKISKHMIYHPRVRPTATSTRPTQKEC